MCRICWPKAFYSNAVTPEVLRLKKRVDSVGQSSRNGARMLITGNPIFDRDGAIKLVAVIEREITDLDAMLVELEATKDKIRSVEAVDGGTGAKSSICARNGRMPS